MRCNFKLLVVSLLAIRTQAGYSGAAIQWVQSQGAATGKAPVLTPQGFAVPPQKLMLTEAPDNESPHFVAKPDGSIAMGDMGWCIGAAGEHMAYVDKCTGGPAQKWNWIPDGLGRNRIQLRDTNRCLVADSEGGVGLQDCLSQMTEAWKFEEPEALPTPNAAYNQFRYVMISLMALAGVGAASLGAWMWQTKAGSQRTFAAATPGVSMTSPAAVLPQSARCGDVSMSARSSQDEETPGWQTKAGQVAAAAALSLAVGVQSANAGPFTRTEIASLTYDQIKGTGLANTCPTVEAGSAPGSIKVGGKKLKIDEFCLEPTSFQVLEEKLTKNGVVTEAVDTKVTTRQTYVLTGMEGDLTNEEGKVVFKEKDGIDYAPATVQMPGGERVPFLFTVKNLVAKSEGSASEIKPDLKLSGNFTVPSYRTGLFLDPKGRGTTTGYDQAVALPALQAGGDESLFAENNKKFDVGKGTIDLKVTEVNAELNEFGGVFVQKQPSDTDLGSKVPKTVLLKGNFFGTVAEP